MSTRSIHAARLAQAWALVALLVSPASPARADEGSTPDVSTLSILDAQRSGAVQVVARGQGANQVRFTITNKSDRRLNVVIPPGLVAAASVSQGFQSMGLGGLSDQPGRFGRIANQASQAGSGFRSVDATPAANRDSVGVSPGQTVDLSMPSVCLNFGIPTPTSKDHFQLKDVSEYTNDARAIKALRSLVELGTSQGVAQAVAWNIFNDMSFESIAKEGREYVNMAEVSLAARFVDALDASGTHDLVDPAYFREGRILIRTQGESSMGKVAQRLAGELQGRQLFGLPVQVVDELSAEHARPASLLIDLTIVGATDKSNETKIKAQLRYNSAVGGWTKLPGVDLVVNLSPTLISGEALAAQLNRSIASAFVTSTPARRAAGTSTLKVVNRLPFTIESVVLRTGRSDGAPEITLDGIGIGPARSAMATIPAPLGLVERITVNGL
jgi:hypothetical protein